MQADQRATRGRLAVLPLLALLGLVIATPAHAGTSGAAIEVCLAPAGGAAPSATFSLNGGTAFRVLSGRCSGSLAVASGPVTVRPAEPDAVVAAITVKPANRQLSVDEATGVATVAAPGGSTAATRTIVTFALAPAGTGAGTIEVCKASANAMGGKAFQFSLNGGALFTVNGGACSGPLAAPAGPNVVTELSSPDGQVSAVAVAPAARLVSSDVPAQSVTASVPAGSTALTRTRVTFTNSPPGGPTEPGANTGDLKLCKLSRSPAFHGRLFSFSLNAGPAFSIEAGAPGSPVCSAPVSYPLGTRVIVQELEMVNVVVESISVSDGRGSDIDPASRKATATIGPGTTVVTFHNEPSPVPQTGFVQVCKDADGPDVSGQFEFTITAPGFSTTESTWVDQCTGPVEVPAGNVTVTETARPGYLVSFVTVHPSDRLFEANLLNRTVVVEVPPGDPSTETQVHFVNRAITAQLKVCKTLAPASEALQGEIFAFDITRRADTEAPGPVVRARVQASASAQCVIVGTFPVGETVSVDEVFREDLPATDPDYGVTPSGEFIDVSGEGAVTIAPGINSVTVTNRAVGLLEICKAHVAGLAPDQRPTFRFRVGGGGIVSVRADACSLPMRVAVGSHSVVELADNDFELDPNAPGGGMEAYPLEREVSKNPGLRTLSVDVPYGAEGETRAMFANRVKQGQIKVCKQIPVTSTDVLADEEFGYTISIGGAAVPVSAIRPGECSLPLGPWNVLQANGDPTAVTVRETGAGPAAIFEVLGITCTGCRGPVTSELSSGTIGFTLGPNTNALTYTNAARP